MQALNTVTENESSLTPNEMKLREEIDMLQSQQANYQRQMQKIMEENLEIRKCLLECEVQCKESLLKVNDMFVNVEFQVKFHFFCVFIFIFVLGVCVCVCVISFVFCNAFRAKEIKKNDCFFVCLF